MPFQKYKKIQRIKMKKFGRCDTVIFGKVLGQERVFLIQNMCPTTEEFISNIYLMQQTHKPVSIEKKLKREVEKKSRKILALYRKGIKIIIPNVKAIEKELLTHNSNCL
ncbi:MAG: type III toxin-antitoxin system CptIN family toxin [Anaerovoracaceae bacterium]